MKKPNIFFLLMIVAIILSGCGGDDENMDPGGGNFGEITSAVIIVNPIINEGSSTDVISGTTRAGISIEAGDLSSVTTDATGLAVIQGLPTGNVPLVFDIGTITLNVIQEKELYDVVVAYTDDVQQIISAVRYPIGGEVVALSPGDNISNASAEDGTIIFLSEGVFTEDVEINGDGVLIFGSWDKDSGPTSVIEGTVTVKGGSTRMRGVKVNQLFTVSANSFSASFCVFNDANITGNGASLIRNEFNGTQITVPSSDAVLLDNKNIP